MRDETREETIALTVKLKSRRSLTAGLRSQLTAALDVLALYEEHIDNMIVDEHTYLDVHRDGFREKEAAQHRLLSLGEAIAAATKTL